MKSFGRSAGVIAILVALMLALTTRLAAADPDSTPVHSSSPSATALTATTASSTVAAGGLAIIEGILADQEGNPVGEGRIRVTLDDEESSDSVVMTDASGAFRTFAEIPSGRQSGEGSLVVEFDGDESHAAARQEITLVVEQVPVVDADARKSSLSSDVAGVSPSLDASGMPVNEDSTQESRTGQERPLSWFPVTLIGLAVVAILGTIGLVVRGSHRRDGTAVLHRVGGLDVLLDHADEDELSRATQAPLDHPGDPRQD